MLNETRTARVLGGLVLAQGAFALIFWKTLAVVIAVGTARYSNFTGRIAKSFFSQDRALIELLHTGSAFLTPLLALGITVSFVGIIIIAFPKQAVQILCALRILRREKSETI